MWYRRKQSRGGGCLRNRTGWLDLQCHFSEWRSINRTGPEALVRAIQFNTFMWLYVEWNFWIFLTTKYTLSRASVLKRGRRASVWARRVEKMETSSQSCRWATVQCTGLVGRCRRLCEDWPNCGRTHKGRPKLGVIMDSAGIKIKIMSLAIYNVIYSWTSTPSEQPDKTKEGPERGAAAKGFEVFHIRTNRCTQNPLFRKLRMGGVETCKITEERTVWIWMSSPNTVAVSVEHGPTVCWVRTLVFQALSHHLFVRPER